MPPLKVIFATHTQPTYIPPLQLSEQQIIVGPNYPNMIAADGKITSLNCPREFDVAKLIDAIPQDQQPDLFVALIDAFLNCVPRNLASLKCRKILIIADTHHGPAPLSNLLVYCAKEKYHRIAVTHDPHHLHWFVEALSEPVSLQLNLNVHDDPQPIEATRAPLIAFVGQVGQYHPRRLRLLLLMSQAGIPIAHRVTAAGESGQWFARSQISFNCSLNGDLNMRVFEVLAAGGCLLTDRLSMASGLETMFVDGRDLILYDDIDDLLEKARYYLTRPELCLEIARNGQQRYLSIASEPIRKKRFLRFALADDITAANTAEFDQQHDTRCRSLFEPTEFWSRVATYQCMQELQRIEAIDRICASANINKNYLDDMSDLHRIRLDLPLGNGTRACLLTTSDQLHHLLQMYTTAPAEYLLILDTNLTDSQKLQTLLGPLGYTRVEFSKPIGSWLYLNSSLTNA